jgi:hypothetical protein
VIEIRHYADELSWRFESSDIPLLSGGGRTCEESREAAEHAVRQYLTQRRRREVTLEEAAAEVRHVCLGSEGVTTHARDEVAGLRAQS